MSSPSYGKDSKGYYKTKSDGSKVYANSSNSKYFPSNYGGTANWKYSGSSSNSSRSSSYSSKSSTSTYTNTGGYNNSGSTSYNANHSSNSTSGYATTSPTYGQDSNGYYKQNGSTKTYVNNSNKQYFPSNYGGTANWKYSGSSSNSLSGVTSGDASKFTPSSNGYYNSFANNTYGKVANDLSYEGIKKQQQVLAEMKGTDESKYANDEFAHRMWQIANGQTNFGTGTSPYKSTEFASGYKRYENDISEASNVAQHLWSQLGNEDLKKFYNMDNQQLAQALNNMGLKAITQDQLRDATFYNYNVNPDSGIKVNPQKYKDYLEFEKTTTTQGKPILSQVLNSNYSMNTNGDTHLRDGLVLVNGVPTHWTNYVKYGDTQAGTDALYKNMLQNEKVTGNTEAIPLKARAALAPETMTDEMKSDLQTQINLENQISSLDNTLSQLDQVQTDRQKKTLNNIAQYAANNASDYGYVTNGNVNNATQSTTVPTYTAQASEPVIGSTSVAGVYNNLNSSNYLDTRAYGKSSQNGEGLGNLTAFQIAQLNAMRNAVNKRNGVI